MSSGSQAAGGAPPRALKGCFPFSLTVPSYLYPATIELNVRMLRDRVDEMELLLFESIEESSLPTPSEVETIRALGAETGLRFDVHLPLDIDIASPVPSLLDRSLRTVMRIVELTEPLRPDSLTLHVLRSGGEDVARWRQRVGEALGQLPAPRSRFCVETLGWDLRDIDDILRALGLSVCIDVGHLLLKGRTVASFLEAFSDRISMVHLHGVQGGKDHRSLSHLDPVTRAAVSDWVRTTRYRRSLSLEVFGLEQYTESLPLLLSMFRPVGEEVPRC